MKEKCKRCGTTIDLNEYGGLEKVEYCSEIFACKKCGCPYVYNSFAVKGDHLINVERYINDDVKEDFCGNKIII